MENRLLKYIRIICLKMKSEEYVTYRVIFVPGRRLSKKAIEIADVISKYGDNYFAVDNEKYFASYNFV